MDNKNVETMYPVQSKKKKKLPIILGIILAVIVVILAIMAMSDGELSDSDRESYIDLVRTGYSAAYGEDISYDEVLKYAFTDGKWSCFISGENKEVAGQIIVEEEVVVEYKGKYTKGGETAEALIQFVIDEDEEGFETYYFEWDGESKDPNEMIKILFDDYIENHS